MASPYSLEQYLQDLRAITAQETDPVKITDRVAPLAQKFAQAPGWFRPEFRECDPEQGFSLHLLHEEPNHDLAVFLISWLPNRGTTPHNHKTWAVGSAWKAASRRLITTGSITAASRALPT